MAIMLFGVALSSLLLNRMASALAIDIIHSAGNLEQYQTNFCNDSELAAANNLTKTTLGQFMGYPCSAEFYHCRWQSDGFHTYKKSCRVGLVFDTAGTQNCNYDYNVRQCGMQANPATCKNDTDFSCPLSESCVPLGQRCDGVYDCVLEEDEQNCPICKPNEFPCVTSEQCIPMSDRCNGIKECRDGTDEMDCDTCPAGNFLCRKSGKCVPDTYRCDGVSHCPHNEDEQLCKRDNSSLYTCENRVDQIARDLVCNGVNDCPDGSDEKYCLHPSAPVQSEKSVEYNLVTDGVLSHISLEPLAASTQSSLQLPPVPLSTTFGGSTPSRTGKLTFPRIRFGSSVSSVESEAVSTTDAPTSNKQDAMERKPTQLKKYRQPPSKVVDGDRTDACGNSEEQGAIDNIPDFIGQSGRKRLNPMGLNYQVRYDPQMAAAANQGPEVMENAPTDDELNEKRQMLRKIEEILHSDPSSGGMMAAQQTPTHPTPFHRFPPSSAKMMRIVTGRPHRWQPSLSTNKVTTTPTSYALYSGLQ